MTKDWMKCKTEIDYTSFDINCGCFTPKYETALKKKIRRKARRNDKKALDKLI